MNLWFVVIVLSFLCLGCAGAPGKKAVAPPPSAERTDFTTITLPTQIDQSNFNRNEISLMEMDADHPQRQALRDLLIRYLADSFSAEAVSADVDSETDRVRAFIDALHLHAQEDFKTGTLSPALSPIAEWVVDHFEPRGKEAKVLAGLKCLALIHPDDERYRREYRELISWVEEVRTTIPDPIEQYTSLTRVYGELARLVPVGEVLSLYADALANRQNAVVVFLKAFRRHPQGMTPALFKLLSRGSIGGEMALAYFLGGRLDGLPAEIRKLNLQAGIDDDLMTMVTQISQNKNLAHNYYHLAGTIGSQYPVAGFKACTLASKLKPAVPRYRLCAGQFLSRMERYETALAYYLEAVASELDAETVAQVMELSREALYRKHLSDDGERGMTDAIDAVATLVRRVASSDIQDKETIFAASSLIEVAAQIAFDDGLIDSALAYFQLAASLWPTRPEPVIRRAEILTSQSEYDAAIALLTRSIESTALGQQEMGLFWKAIFLEARGDVYWRQDDRDRARGDYREALDVWEQADYPLEQEPMVSVRKGVLLGWVGDIESSNEAFRKAIRVDPERRSSYGDIISNLVKTRRLEDAQTFYRLAFNQDRLEPMWKIYFSLWVEYLSLWTTGESDNLAKGYLCKAAGNGWQASLAQHLCKEIDYQTLLARAQTKGNRIEAHYYEALLRLTEGRKAEARGLLQQVIASNMIAYFEYRMAVFVLASLEDETSAASSDQ